MATIIGTGFDDELDGGVFGDTILANAGNDTVTGNGGGDSILGGAGGDAISGEAGNDTIDGGADTDRLDGGAGDDVVTADEDDLTLEGDIGFDTLNVSDLNLSDFALVTGFEVLNGENLVMTGSFAATIDVFQGRNFTLTGGSQIDVKDFSGFSGGSLVGSDSVDFWSNFQSIGDNVIFNTLGGNDHVHLFLGAATGVRVLGGSGNDILSGAQNMDDWLEGEADNDTILGGGGDDTMIGGAGVDQLHGSTGDDLIIADKFDSSIDGSSGIDTLDASGLDINTLPAANVFNMERLIVALTTLSSAQIGEFTAISGTSMNIVGNADFDGIDLSGFQGTINGLGVNNIDLASVLGGPTLIQMGAGNDTFSGSDLGDSAYGQVGNDSMLGALGDDYIDGGDGDDTLRGNEGHDILRGGIGNDSIDAGIGDDFLRGGAATTQNVLRGGAGNDFYSRVTSVDQIIEAAGEGNDTVESAINMTLGSTFENLILRAGSSATIGFGNTGANLIVGNALANTLSGNSGNDTMDGGSGADTMFGDADNDTLIGGFGKDRMTGGAGADKFQYFSVNESGVAASSRDDIVGFSSAGGDKVDLAAIDATPSVGDQAFAFIGTAAFSTWGQLRYIVSAGSVILQGNTDSDETDAEFSIRLESITSVAAGDFVL
jgi:Ca2+-binding RTX toxin-like protein